MTSVIWFVIISADHTKSNEPKTEYQQWIYPSWGGIHSDLSEGLKTADIDAQGRRTEYVYWKDRRLKYTYDVAANLYTVPTYDKDGRVTQIQVRQTNWKTGTRVAQTKTEYDAMGRPIKAHSFNNNNWITPYATTESTYDIFGNRTQSKDPRALITTYTHDQHGLVTKQTLPDGDWVETRYNILSQPTKAWTSQTGSKSSPAVRYTYDTLNRTSQVDYSTGEWVSYAYDKGDNRLTQKTHDGSQTYTYTYSYDQLNRLITREDKTLLGYKTLYEYDDASMRTRMHIQPAGGGRDLYDVTYTYDEANRLLSVTDGLAAKTGYYEYFDIGALKTVTNPNGITAHRTLDTRHRLDRLEYKKDPTTVLSSLDYTYDVKSNVTKLIRNDTGAGGSSKTFTFGYDGISRLTSANYGNETVRYTYDKSGNRLTQVSSVDGTTTYTVATNSNQLTHRSLVPEDTDFATMSYSYDAEGKLTQRSEGTDSDAFTYSFGSQLTQIQQTRAGVVDKTLTYAYNGSGQRVKVTDGSGTRYFLYDGGMPILELDANKKITASYLYGADGVVYCRKHTAVAHWHFDEGTGTLAHDVDGGHTGTLGNGEAAKTPAWALGCGGGLLFDGVDDLVQVPDSDALDLAGSAMTLSCWVKPNRSQIGPLLKKINPTHGYRINVTATGALRFVLRRNGQNTIVTSTATLPLNKWTHVAARYDGKQMRIFINGTLDAATTPATAANTPRATTAPVLIGGDSSTHRFSGTLDDVSIYGRALSDSEIADLANIVDRRYEYHHLNALGSNIVLTDDNQNVLVRYEYDVFGAIRNETGTSDNTRKFTGKEFDADSNLYYYAARYYDPYIGRFTQRDPIADGVNWYIYTENNPLRFVDPDGLLRRKLNSHETGVAQNFFGDMINLGRVRINESGIRYRILTRKKTDQYVTVYRTIYGKNMSDDVLIHELVHVWQYEQVRLDPLGALTTHAIAAARGKTNDLYKYEFDDLSDPNRKTFREYTFEQQAQIIQDAFRLQVMGDIREIKNQNWKRGELSFEDLKLIYERFIEEFKQWHQELQQSRSDPYWNYN